MNKQLVANRTIDAKHENRAGNISTALEAQFKGTSCMWTVEQLDSGRWVVIFSIYRNHNNVHFHAQLDRFFAGVHAALDDNGHAQAYN